MRRIRVLLLVLAPLAVLAAASPGTSTPHARGGAAPGAPPRSPAGVASAAARIGAGHSVRLLSVRGLGRWTAYCSRDRLVHVVFRAHFLLPTSDLVVTRTAGPPLSRRIDPRERVAPDPPGTVLAQRWQIIPFAAARVQVSVANVAGRTVSSGCAASVLVTTGPDQGPTITG